MSEKAASVEVIFAACQSFRTEVSSPEVPHADVSVNEEFGADLEPCRQLLQVFDGE